MIWGNWGVGVYQVSCEPSVEEMRLYPTGLLPVEEKQHLFLNLRVYVGFLEPPTRRNRAMTLVVIIVCQEQRTTVPVFWTWSIIMCSSCTPGGGQSKGLLWCHYSINTALQRSNVSADIQDNVIRLPYGE